MSIIYNISKKDVFFIKLLNNIFSDICSSMDIDFRYTKIEDYRESSLEIHLNTFNEMAIKSFNKLHQRALDYLYANLFSNQIYISDINNGFCFKFYSKCQLSDDLVTLFKMKGI